MDHPTPVQHTPASDDLLSEILTPLRLQGVFVSHWQMSGAWGVYGEREPCALIHYMLRGEATIDLGPAGRTTLHAGDLALFPLGEPHAIGAPHCLTPLPLHAALPDRSVGGVSTLRLGPATPDADAEMLCVGLHYETEGILPLYELLPDLLTLRRAHIQQDPLLHALLQNLTQEAIARQEGRGLILLRGFELVYLAGLRHSLKNAPASSPINQLTHHAGLSRALIAIYREYAQRWNVTSLAERAGMSRSSFCAKFRALLGESPGRHLMRRRVMEARRLLLTTTLTHDEIADAVGYESAVGLYLAFRSVLNVTPGEVRSAPRALDASSA
ncbi:AraC family transcriptional regulator [Deinococcus maricopensis]|uniref:Transcriptional regulator, AraC family n=1 Tax=Deinococcus maricopensis (strain DSM 21211 / LMG 22137 / NRRL B-23946 / LB-34) TaxID=709986 RepID=E8U442_DEIML|nr:AraC family transcriptional regulator [Deinococcus maricopensis]ADV65879.1 transcriptional regulator, AraC family [Deinococcus maricopensis DSM 21211]